MEYRDHEYRKDRKNIEKHKKYICGGGGGKKSLEKHLCNVKLDKNFVYRTQKVLCSKYDIIYLTLLVILYKTPFKNEM